MHRRSYSPLDGSGNYRDTCSNCRMSEYSTGGKVPDEYRGSLTPNTVQVLICTQNCISAQLQGNLIF